MKCLPQPLAEAVKIAEDRKNDALDRLLSELAILLPPVPADGEARALLALIEADQRKDR